MKKTFEDFSNIFFWNFKRMDNANYNFSIAETLFEIKNKNHSLQLNKPITLLLVSIIECILYDFIQRIQGHVHEAIPNIDEKIINDTRNKTCEKFNVLIAHIEKHDLLDISNNPEIYSNLNSAQILRNRIHIQNQHKQLDKDETKIWTDANVLLISNLLENICRVFSSMYPRPKRELISISDFPKPWINGS